MKCKSIVFDGTYIKRINQYPSLSSTNSWARRLVSAGCEENTVIWSQAQTKGRGRRGRVWLSDQGSLTFSVIWKFKDYGKIPLLSLMTAIWVAQAMAQYSLDVKVKWPNDLYIQRQKLGGILGESIMHNQALWVVMGVGININGLNTDQLDIRAISLQQHTKEIYQLREVLKKVLLAIDKGLISYLEGADVNDLLTRYGNFLGQTVEVHQGEASFRGQAISVRNDGCLIVATDTGQKIVRSTDCSLQIP